MALDNWFACVLNPVWYSDLVSVEAIVESSGICQVQFHQVEGSFHWNGGEKLAGTFVELKNPDVPSPVGSKPGARLHPVDGPAAESAPSHRVSAGTGV